MWNQTLKKWITSDCFHTQYTMCTSMRFNNPEYQPPVTSVFLRTSKKLCPIEVGRFLLIDEICTSCYSGTISHRRLIFRIMKSHRIYTLCTKYEKNRKFWVCDFTWNDPYKDIYFNIKVGLYYLFDPAVHWLHPGLPGSCGVPHYWSFLFSPELLQMIKQDLSP